MQEKTYEARQMEYDSFVFFFITTLSTHRSFYMVAATPFVS